MTKKNKLALNLNALAILISLFVISCKTTENSFNIVYTSDAHYGITREAFQGKTKVEGYIVNGAMIKQINTISNLNIPNDKGVKSDEKVGPVDYLFQTGDIANRMEHGDQSASESWNQFLKDYTSDLTLKDEKGNKTKLYVIPGNHDVSNAIGHFKIKRATDAASMVGIWNMMMGSTKTSKNYNYDTDKIHYSFDRDGIHFVFLCIWPDSAERTWIDKDIANVHGPVILFTHDQPDLENKHLTNPNNPPTINEIDKFENLLVEKCKDGYKKGEPTTIEQRSFSKWIKEHPMVKAYFHGNQNSNEFYTYTGPDKDISLPTFRVDSPMKGDISAKDETKLSFQLITIDAVKKRLTVRECLWNTDPSNPAKPIVFGESKTISLN